MRLISIVVGLAAGCDDGDEGSAKPWRQVWCWSRNCVEELLLPGAGDGLEIRDGLLHAGDGVVVGLQEAGVGGDLVAAQAGFLVDDERLDQGGQGDSAGRIVR